MPAKLITAIRVEKLFGLYTYSLPESGQMSNASILYGDNGVGKSTLLRLVFHLLSAANDKGHRTALSNADFKVLEVDLSSGVTLTARPVVDGDLKILHLEIKKEESILALWDHFQGVDQRRFFEDGDSIIEVIEGGKGYVRRQIRAHPKKGRKIPSGNEAYLSVLMEHAPNMFILNAERRLDSDAVSDPSDEVELRRMMNLTAPKRINELVVKSREIALSQALGSASRWIGNKAIKGTNQGSMNVHSVYVDVLHRLVGPTASSGGDILNLTSKALATKLANIESQMGKHAQYELATKLSTTEFQKALSRTPTKSNIAAELLQPYITSLEKRLEAVEPIYQIIDRFVATLNSFLKDKNISFKISQGFKITSDFQGATLEPSQLSSGEQQLLLLFCYVLTARDKPSIFMIDEPEISLNVKWQRQLVQSLLDVSDGANVQFIFASHSMELLAQHRNRVVKLTNKP
jgi:energy-coupling factor transporter ATP-binding protein EcfA2